MELDDFDELLNDAEQLAAKESIVGKGVDMNGPLISPRLVNQNYLENLYRKMEARDQVMYQAQQQSSDRDQVDQGAQRTTSQSLPPQKEEKDKSASPPPKILNKDLVMETEESKPVLPVIKKTVIRKAQADAFFKTGVDVIEHEEYEFEGTTQDAADALKEGKLTA